MSTSNAKIVAGKSYPFRAGAFEGVDSTIFPDDDAPNELTDALNCYLPDPMDGCEVAARPGFTKTAGYTIHGCYDVFSVNSNGTIYNFSIQQDGVGFKLYNVGGSPTALVYTDVTPVGITISAPAGGLGPGFMFMTQLNGALIVSDSVNRPWVGTDLGNTPITGTYIDIDGAATAWAAIGEPQVYVGSLFFICATTTGNVQGGVSIVWSEPNQPGVGYQQSGFADWWNLIQTSNKPLFALKATDLGLYYFRALSIGLLTGTPSINFQNTATNDAVGNNVGAVASKTIRAFGNYLYFCDQVGRPWRMALGGSPEPIWLKMRQYYEALFGVVNGPAAPLIVQLFAWAIIEPNLNLYIVVPWSVPATGSWGNTAFIFDANTGVYVGRWQINDSAGAHPAAGLTVGGILQDAYNDNFLVILGTLPSTGGTLPGTAWTLNLLQGLVWQDNSTVPSIVAQTQRLGYASSTEWSLDTVRVLTNNVTPVALTTVATNGTVSQGNATPPASSDGTFLSQWKPMQTTGRGFQLQISPTTATSQWKLFRAEIDCTAADVQTSDA